MKTRKSITRKSTAVTRQRSAVSNLSTGDTRAPINPAALDALRAELGIPRACPEGIANDPGYLSQRLSGLSELVRAASHEDGISQEAAFFITAAMDDIAERFTR